MEQLKTYKCVNCGKEFTARDGFECYNGVGHVVAEKTYYLNDAPAQADKYALRRSSTTVNHIPPEKKEKDAISGELRPVPGGSVVFIGGKFSTSDPEQQFWLDRRGIDVGYESWKVAYHSKEQLQALKEGELVEREREADRKVKEANDLLASVQTRVKSAGKPEMLSR